MNVLLAFNSVLAVLVLFASTAGVIGWIVWRLLKRVARLLAPLASDEEQSAPTRPRPRPRLTQTAGAKATE